MRILVVTLIIIVGFSGCVSISSINTTHASCSPGSKGNIDVSLSGAVNSVDYDWRYAPFFSPPPSITNTKVSSNEDIVAKPGQYHLEVGYEATYYGPFTFNYYGIPVTINQPKNAVITKDMDVYYSTDWENITNATFSNNQITPNLVAPNAEATASIKNKIFLTQSVFYDFVISYNSNNTNPSGSVIIGFDNASSSALSTSFIGIALTRLPYLYGQNFRLTFKSPLGFKVLTVPSNLAQNIEQDLFKIRITKTYNPLTKKCLVEYKVNGQDLYSEYITFTNQKKFCLGIIGNQFNGIRVKNIFTSAPCLIPNTLNYATLKKNLDGGYNIFSNNVLHIKYNQQYNSQELNYAIYNEDRIAIIPNSTVNFNLKTGDNYIDIPFNGNLNQFYFLEVTDAKGEVYKLKFVYK